MNRWRYLSVAVLALTAIYLYAFPTATIVYAAAVLLHTGLGVLLVLGLLVYLFRGLSVDAWPARIGWVLMAGGAAVGVALIYLGTSHRMDKWLYAHIALCSLGVVRAGNGVDEGTRMVGRERTSPGGCVWRGARGCGGNCRRCLVGADSCVEQRVSHNKSSDLPGDHGQRRRRPTR